MTAGATDGCGTRVVIPIDEQRVRELIAEAGKVSQRGCICPPRSEETCKGIMCPRSAWRMP